MKKHLLLILVFINSLVTVQAQNIGWTAFGHLSDSLRAERRPVLVFIYADWCKYCRMQERITFSSPDLVHRLNKSFYCLRLNAEERENRHFLGRSYHYEPSGTGTGQHQLAGLLGKQQGTLTLPTTVLLSSDLQIVARLPGFLERASLEAVLREWLPEE
ncbi:MAG: thioredoxin fold domain-containing protein [Bacteroidia bacterium]|nr:thioredoxin fold domain-containing protein [Bacteroidia bacterium]